jgi:hypothetical protein
VPLEALTGIYNHALKLTIIAATGGVGRQLTPTSDTSSLTC